MVGILTSWKWANATNQGSLGAPEPVSKHLPAYHYPFPKEVGEPP